MMVMGGGKGDGGYTGKPKKRTSKKERKEERRRKEEEKGRDDNIADEESAESKKPAAAAPPHAPLPSAGTDFASLMMSQLTALKTKTSSEAASHTARKASLAEAATAAEDARIAALTATKKTGYKVVDEVELVTAYTKGVKSSVGLSTSDGVVHINRPEDVKRTRVNLPVVSMETEIVEAVRSNDVVVLCGETGSGKSTQVPQFLLEAYGGSGGMIGVTQPRRVAAVSTGKRVAYECGVGDGFNTKEKDNLVGWQTRYEKAGIGGKTKVKFMTDGILLAEVKEDLLLRRYKVVVLDEAHERSMNTDVLLGLLDGAVRLRREAGIPNLKVVIMSATLRVEDFTGEGGSSLEQK
jgi:HrpA-like RNA helicase